VQTFANFAYAHKRSKDSAAIRRSIASVSKICQNPACSALALTLRWQYKEPTQRFHTKSAAAQTNPIYNDTIARKLARKIASE